MRFFVHFVLFIKFFVSYEPSKGRFLFLKLSGKRTFEGFLLNCLFLLKNHHLFSIIKLFFHHEGIIYLYFRFTYAVLTLISRPQLAPFLLFLRRLQLLLPDLLRPFLISYRLLVTHHHSRFASLRCLLSHRTLAALRCHVCRRTLVLVDVHSGVATADEW